MRQQQQRQTFLAAAVTAKRPLLGVWPTNRNVVLYHDDLELILLVGWGLGGWQRPCSSRQRLNQTATHLKELDHLVRSSVIIAVVILENRARGVGFAAVWNFTKTKQFNKLATFQHKPKYTNIILCHPIRTQK